MKDQPTETERFTRDLTIHSQFRDALGNAGYHPVPDDWLIAVSDVVDSRKAIAKGRYKAVNMAGVAYISAAMNALGSQAIPYIFGGDGVALICAPEQEDVLRQALARTIRWVGDELELELRGAMVPVRDVSRQGAPVHVSAIQISPSVNNYAFTGGGISLAEKMMKAGKYPVEAADAGQSPDLSGLSCRWTPIEAEDRIIASIIIEPGQDRDSIPQATAVRISGVISAAGSGHPVPGAGPRFVWPPKGLDMEARASRGDRSLLARKFRLYLVSLFAWFLDRTGIPLSNFDPKHYRRVTALNTDYRKIQDGLRMTVSLSAQELAEVRRELEQHRTSGEIRFGICEQKQALLTCYVPSISSDSHFHFVDGAGGGYAQAASSLH